MHVGIRLALPLTFALGIASCGDPTPEEVADDTVGVLNDMSAALEKVTSKETAKKAVDTIKGLIPRMKKLTEKYKSMEKPTAELKAKYEAKFGQAMQRLMAAAQKLEEYPEEKKAFEDDMKAVDF